MTARRSAFLVCSLLLWGLWPTVLAAQSLEFKPPFPLGYEPELLQPGLMDVHELDFIPKVIGDTVQSIPWPSRSLVFTRDVGTCTGRRLKAEYFWNWPKKGEPAPDPRSPDMTVPVSGPCAARATVYFVQHVPKNWGASPEDLHPGFRTSETRWVKDSGRGIYTGSYGAEALLLGRIRTELVYITVSIPPKVAAATADTSTLGQAAQDALAWWDALAPAGEDDAPTDGSNLPGVPPWAVVVGGAAAVAAAAGAIARTMRKARTTVRPQSQLRDPNAPKKYSYVLQLSANQIAVEPNTPGTFTVTAWKVDEAGVSSPAPGVSLTVTSADAGLVPQPASGAGQLACAVSLVTPTAAPSVVLTVTGRAAGQTIRSTVTATVTVGYRIETTTNPAGARQLRPGTSDSFALYARVVNTTAPDTPDAACTQATAALHFDDTAPGSDWTARSAAVVQGGWKAITVSIAQPAPTTPPPTQIPITISGTVHGQSVSTVFTVDVAASDIQVSTVDAKGKPTTTLREGETGVVYLFAGSKAGGPSAAALNAGILFPRTTGVVGIDIEDLGTQHDQRCARLSVSPTASGTLPPRLTLTVTAEQGRVKVPVTLQIEVVLGLTGEMLHRDRVTSSGRPYPVYDAWVGDGDETWTFGDVLLYFRSRASTDPVKPATIPEWDAPRVDPDYLDVAEPVSADGGLTWRCAVALRDGVAVPEDWRTRDGIVRLTFDARVGATAGAGPGASAGTQTFTLGVRLPPLVTLVCQTDADPVEGRPVYGLAVGVADLICDGDDEIGLECFAHDRGDRDDPTSQADFTLEDVVVEIEGPARSSFTVTPDPDATDPGRPAFRLRSTEALLFTGSQPAAVTLRATARARPTQGDTTKTYEVKGTLTIRPRYLYLMLWVVPGEFPHTSEAECYACLAPRTADALRDFPVELRVEALGAGQLTVEGTGSGKTNEHGQMAWVLRYSGLTWDNVASACFAVRCGPAACGPPQRGTAVVIDVGANVTRLAETIYDQQDSQPLRLNNNAFTPSALDFAIPDWMSGGYTNLLGPKAWDDYVCGNYAHRLYDWMALRRHGNTSTQDVSGFSSMNGIELNLYAMWMLGPFTHHFAGIHLSGTAPLDDPRFADPWWRQEWRDRRRRNVGGWLTKNDERLLLVGAIAYFPAITAAGAALTGGSAGFLGTMGLIGGGLPATDLTFGDVHIDRVAIFTAEGTYAVYLQNWGRRAREHLCATHATTLPVANVQAW